MSSDSEDCEENDFNDETSSDDILKILVTTDNHLGFMEKDPERGEDSYIAFEEALQIAEREQVDFILLGGDLFHENKPSRDCLAKCQSLLRKYCFGIKPIDFNIVSDEHVNFGHTNFPYANFNDPNLNISIPVFSIHGNHDDPTGVQNLCALDILASAGLANYFGKCNTNMQNEIQINPVLIEKGETKLAIFGLGAVKDERLHHLFEKGMVKVNRPSESVEDWFNIFVIHQNRVVHGKKNYIPETFLEGFLDLVIWGHEHECRLRPEYNELKEFYVSQPGSTVITSLSESEAVPKCVGILKIQKKKFKLDPIELTSIRPFLMDNITLKSYGISKTDKNLELKIEQICMKKVRNLLVMREIYEKLIFIG
jgi:double-strand break repair protein MRE11